MPRRSGTTTAGSGSITTNVGTTGALNFLVTAEDPAGPWSDPVPVPVAGIDPDIAWDEEGNCWVHFSGMGGIARSRIDPSTGHVLAGPDLTWSGTGLQYPEAPHLFERDGTWYLMIAEGGTHGGHAVSIARAPSPVGPWEGAPSNPILSHRSTDQPIQNTGHADIVEATDGTWWMVLLGVRPHGVAPGFHVLGRETFLTPVDWVNGWPVPHDVQLEMDGGPPGPTAPAAPAGRDDFDTFELGPRWVGVRRPPHAVSSLRSRPGWLVLKGGEATLDSPEPVFVGRRQQHRWCRVRARVDAGAASEAGLTLMMDETSHYEVGVHRGQIIVRARVGPLDTVVAERAVPARPRDPDDRHGAPPARTRCGLPRLRGRRRRIADSGPPRRALPVHGGHGWLPRPYHRDVRRRRRGSLRLVRLRGGVRWVHLLVP